MKPTTNPLVQLLIGQCSCLVALPMMKYPLSLLHLIIRPFSSQKKKGVPHSAAPPFHPEFYAVGLPAIALSTTTTAPTTASTESTTSPTTAASARFLRTCFIDC